MLTAYRRRRLHATRAQALVELALVVPLLFGIIVVLFQFGILFMSYLTLIHMTRDSGRWLAVHPNTQDADVALYVAKDLPTSVMVPTEIDAPGYVCTLSGSTWSCASHATNGTPADGGLYVDFTPTCGTYNSTTKHCMTGAALTRGSGSMQSLTITYDAAARMFLPSTFNFGWLSVPMPGRYQSYTYYVMVEPA